MMDYDAYCRNVLFENFPSIKELDEYKKFVDYFGLENNAGFLYETVFVPYILNIIKHNPKDNKIKRAFKMIEDLLQHENFHVQCVAEVEFIEPFLVKLKPTKDVERYLMPKSLAAARKLARKWFKINPDSWEATP